MKIVSVIALNEVALPAIEGGHIFNTEQLSQHFDWNSIGLYWKSLEISLFHKPLTSIDAFEKLSVTTYWIPKVGRVVVMVSESTEEHKLTKDIDFFEYWGDCEKVIRENWSLIESNSSLPSIDWVFSFIISNANQESQWRIPDAALSLSSKHSWICGDGLNALIDWNGAFIMNDLDKSNASDETLIGIVAIISIQWQVDLMTIKTIRKLLSGEDSKIKKEQETIEMAKLARRSNLAQVKLLSIYVNDHIIPKLFRKAWAMDEFKNQVNSTIQRIATLNEIESTIHSRLSNSKQESLLFLISLTGVSGAVAAVIATVDFKNSFISSESWRFILVALSAVAIAFFAYINRKKLP